jgi:hypothetical protein
MTVMETPGVSWNLTFLQGLSVTKWSNNGEGKPERVLKYIMPVNNPMGK